MYWPVRIAAPLVIVLAAAASFGALYVSAGQSGKLGPAEDGPKATRALAVAGARHQGVTDLDRTICSPAARAGGMFFETNVRRRRLDVGYTLVTPKLRQGLSKSQWMTGNIPIVPFGLEAYKLLSVRLAWRESTEECAFRFGLVDIGEHQPGIFLIVAKKLDHRWLIDYWAPAGVAGGGGHLTTQ